MADPRAHIVVHALTLAYGDRVVLTDIQPNVPIDAAKFGRPTSLETRR